jgi:hypothetical protein
MLTAMAPSRPSTRCSSSTTSTRTGRLRFHPTPRSCAPIACRAGDQLAERVPAGAGKRAPQVAEASIAGLPLASESVAPAMLTHLYAGQAARMLNLAELISLLASDVADPSHHRRRHGSAGWLWLARITASAVHVVSSRPIALVTRVLPGNARPRGSPSPNRQRRTRLGTSKQC